MGGAPLRAARAALRHPLVAITAVVSTSLFGELTKDRGWAIAAGVLSVLAALLAALQQVLKYSELAEKHKAASQQYGRLRRRIEVIVATDGSEKTIEAALPELQEEWDTLDGQSPSLPQDLYDRARDGVKAKAEPEKRPPA